jgi:hypothetical protein
VLPFFASLNLVCPITKMTADFLQEVVTESDQKKFWTKPGEAWNYISPKRLAATFYETPRGQVGSHEGDAKLKRRLQRPLLWRVTVASRH